MSKQAISVTLDEGNLTWLKARAGASGVRSVSELLDHIVAAARGAGGFEPSRSVVGTVDIDGADPLLEEADGAIRALFDASRRHPSMAVKSSPGRRTPKRKRRRG
jgi:hypothetical protein